MNATVIPIALWPYRKSRYTSYLSACIKKGTWKYIFLQLKNILLPFTINPSLITWFADRETLRFLARFRLPTIKSVPKSYHFLCWNFPPWFRPQPVDFYAWIGRSYIGIMQLMYLWIWVDPTLHCVVRIYKISSALSAADGHNRLRNWQCIILQCKILIMSIGFLYQFPNCNCSFTLFTYARFSLFWVNIEAYLYLHNSSTPFCRDSCCFGKAQNQKVILHVFDFFRWI